MPNYKILPMESHHTLTRIEYGKSSSYLMLLQQAPRGIRVIGPSLQSAANFFLFPLEGEREQTRSTLPGAGSSKLFVSPSACKFHCEPFWARIGFQTSSWGFLCVSQLDLLYFLAEDRLMAVLLIMLHPQYVSWRVGEDRKAEEFETNLTSSLWTTLPPRPWLRDADQGFAHTVVSFSHITTCILLLTSPVYLLFIFPVQTYIYRYLYIQLAQNLADMHIFW